ncbi:MAG: hypothetical protein ACO1QR_06875, partial [Chthoniobacteraceae bacterium]
SAQVETQGKLKNAVAHLVGKYEVHFDPNTISVKGSLGWAKAKQMTTFNLVVLRVLMYSVGRFNPDMIRKLLQRMLITGKKPAPLSFSRKLAWEGSRLKVEDALSAETWAGVKSVGVGASQTSIYVVMSRTFQAGQMQPWIDLTEQRRKLTDGDALRLERTL